MCVCVYLFGGCLCKLCYCNTKTWFTIYRIVLLVRVLHAEFSVFICWFTAAVGSVKEMAAPPNVEMEAAKFLHQLIQDSKDEPSKLATKLYVVCDDVFFMLLWLLVWKYLMLLLFFMWGTFQILQHMRASGKENSMPYQVISRYIVSKPYLDVSCTVLGCMWMPWSCTVLCWFNVCVCVCVKLVNL